MNVNYRVSAALICALSASTAMAVTPLQTSTTVNVTAASTQALSASVVVAGRSASDSGSASAAAVALPQFDTSTGILVGARLAVQTPVSTTAQVTGTVRPSGGGRTVSANASMTGTVSAPGVSFSSGAIAASRSCTGGNCPNSPSNNSAATQGTISGSAAVAQANLAAYAGTGSVSVSRSASGSAQVTTGSGALTGTGRGLFTFGGATPTANAYTITYDYLAFANPSFAGQGSQRALSLDFGTLAQNSGPVLLNVTLYNLGNASSAGLVLNGISRAAGNLAFATDAAPFASLAAGDSVTFGFSFNPIALGVAHELFTLALADYAPGGIGIRDYTMTVDSIANVVAAPSAVPEPAQWAMLLAGFGVVGSMMRRRPMRQYAA